jgi:PhnB protein
MAKVQAVPTGYTTVTPFLNIKGASEAIELYKRAFNAEERSKMAMPNGKIMHAELKIGNAILMLSDAMQQPATSSATRCGSRQPPPV